VKDINFIISIIDSTLRMAAPLIFAAIGGVFSERSGVANIGIEGMMIMGAFFSVLGTYKTGSTLAGILCAVLAGAAISALLAFLSIHLKSDQIIVGTAINIFAAAFTSFMIFKVFKLGGQTEIVKGIPFNVPKAIVGIPILGKFVSGLNWFIIAAFILVVVANFILFKTPLGLRIRAVGEKPIAADTMGISVYKIRYLCVIISGALAGIGGSCLTLGMTPIFKEGMVSGRGFIALAALIFGNWKPYPTMIACIVFALGNALQINAQGLAWHIPNELYAMFPYILTMLALAGFVGKTVAPAADGVPYEKGQR
jgi:simple sugar transport system permease protein